MSADVPERKVVLHPGRNDDASQGRPSGIHPCLTEKMLTYSLGRGLERYDRKTVEDISRKLEASGYQFQTLIFEIVRSLPSSRGAERLQSPVV